MNVEDYCCFLRLLGVRGTVPLGRLWRRRFPIALDVAFAVAADPATELRDELVGEDARVDDCEMTQTHSTYNARA